MMIQGNDTRVVRNASRSTDPVLRPEGVLHLEAISYGAVVVTFQDLAQGKDAKTQTVT